jgi:hypothetical protein
MLLIYPGFFTGLPASATIGDCKSHNSIPTLSAAKADDCVKSQYRDGKVKSSKFKACEFRVIR